MFRGNLRAHAILFQPAIAGNLGCIYRSCFGFSASLHVIGPLPFDLSSKQLHRGAGNRLEPSLRLSSEAPPASDAPPFVFYSNVEDFCERGLGKFDFIGALTKFSERSIYQLGNDLRYFNRQQGDSETIDAAVLLGNESHGLSKLPPPIHALLHGEPPTGGSHDSAMRPRCVPYHLPMHPAARSYNLAVSAGIGLYELTRPVER